jgi:hypothetical protein
LGKGITVEDGKWMMEDGNGERNLNIVNQKLL